METNKISEKHRVTLKEPYQWEYNPHDLGSYKTSRLLEAVEDIDGITEVEYDMSDDKSFFITIDTNHQWGDIKKLVRTLANE